MARLGTVMTNDPEPCVDMNRERFGFIKVFTDTEGDNNSKALVSRVTLNGVITSAVALIVK